MGNNNTKDVKVVDHELELWCELLLKSTAAMVKNPTKAIKSIFDRASREEWLLSKFPKHLASVKAYKEFKKLTGLDIRNYNWFSRVKTKNGKSITIHQYFVDEHLTTAYDFKNTLKNYCQQGILTIDLIKDLIFQQRLCWITKEENKKLNSLGYRKHRISPLDAYAECEIEIYDKENENLKSIMKPDFVINKNKSISKNGSSKNLIRIEFFNKLKEYFKKTVFDGLTFELKIQNEHAYIYSLNNLLINVRVKDGVLNDICVYIKGDNAKKIFDKFLKDKDNIENELGYKLVWDRNNTKKATRIGRFGIYSTNPNQYGISDENENVLNEVIAPYNFDLNVEKVAHELVNFYKAFVKCVNTK